MLALAAPFLVASVSAYGNSVIKNSCSSPVYFWEDDGQASPPLQTIAAGQSYTKELYQTPKSNGAGPSFKLAHAKSNGAMPDEMNDPITQFEYTVNAQTSPGLTFFDISNVNGATDGGVPPFIAGGLSVSSPQDPSASRTCPAGQNPCTQGYTNSNDNWATASTQMNNDIVMDICGPKPGASLGGGSGGSQGGNNSPAPSPSPSPSSSAAPPPPPSSSAAPPAPPAPSPPPAKPEVQEKVAQQPAPAQNPEASTQVVWVTEYAPAETVVVHVNGKRDEAKEKREEHIHNHAHAHNKINKRRHGA